MSPSSKTPASKAYLLDTNVLIHDPFSVCKFAEHPVYLPMTVLEELDKLKRGNTDASQSSRQAIRLLESVIDGVESGATVFDLTVLDETATGGLRMLPGIKKKELKKLKLDDTPDNQILAATISGVKHGLPVTLVTNDLNLRLKARAMGVDTEAYKHDQSISDASILPTGIHYLDPSVLNLMGAGARERQARHERRRSDNHAAPEVERSGHATLYTLPRDAFVTSPELGETAVLNDMRYRIIKVGAETVTLVHAQGKRSACGIHARNLEQEVALELLMNPDIHFVSLLGDAGTGKTLLTLAAALSQIESGLYRDVVITRATVTVGEDIGFLPGTEEEKMLPWMGAVQDSLEVLTGIRKQGEDNETAPTGKSAAKGGKHAKTKAPESEESDLAQKVKLKSMAFMRGRTFHNRFVIIDEAQNLTPKQIKTLITRAGAGAKIVCMGNLAQIDHPSLSATNSGLTYVANRFRGHKIVGHLILQKGERSELADLANERL